MENKISKNEAERIVDYVLKLFTASDPGIRCDIRQEYDFPRITMTIPVQHMKSVELEWDSMSAFAAGCANSQISEYNSVFGQMRTLVNNKSFLLFRPETQTLISALAAIDHIESFEELKLRFAAMGVSECI